jgi:site-specific recombinase XerD
MPRHRPSPVARDDAWYHSGRPPRDKGFRHPPDPPSVEEIVAVMRCAGETAHGLRAQALMVVLWRSGLRISEALALAESDMDMSRGAVLVRRGTGGRRREVGMAHGPGSTLERWLALRGEMPVGALLCVINGPTAGRPWAAPAARTCLRRTSPWWHASAAAFAPTQLRHAHAVEMAREGVPLHVIQRASSATPTSA